MGHYLALVALVAFAARPWVGRCEMVRWFLGLRIDASHTSDVFSAGMSLVERYKVLRSRSVYAAIGTSGGPLDLCRY